MRRDTRKGGGSPPRNSNRGLDILSSIKQKVIYE